MRFAVAYELPGPPCCPHRVGYEGEFPDEQAAIEHGRKQFGDRAVFISCRQLPDSKHSKEKQDA